MPLVTNHLLLVDVVIPESVLPSLPGVEAHHLRHTLLHPRRGRAPLRRPLWTPGVHYRRVCFEGCGLGRAKGTSGAAQATIQPINHGEAAFGDHKKLGVHDALTSNPHPQGDPASNSRRADQGLVGAPSIYPDGLGCEAQLGGHTVQTNRFLTAS